MIKITNSLLCGSLALLVGVSVPLTPAFGQEMPNSALTNYATFRTALLRQGWSADRTWGPKQKDGTPMYRYPEVLCGNSMCSAQWVARNKRKFNITLWKDDAGNLRVAPQIDWSE